MANLLMVEDNPANAAVYAEFLAQHGHKVNVVDTGVRAIAWLEETQPDLILLDLKLPDMEGSEIIEKISQHFARYPTIVLTGNGSIATATASMRAGAIDFLMKPCSAENLVASVSQGLMRTDEKFEQQVENVKNANVGKQKGTKPKPNNSGFLGESGVMENVFSLIHAAGKSTASVFVTGESGTGKELCAKAIHQASDRHDSSFVALNCAAIPKDLIESEIFGHRKGAFTGAVENREGAASLANGGTLFLDEICEMDPDLQAKLLRFIQTGTYKRVGDGTDRETDIRFVCATNRDPAIEVQNGRFREDLYYRLFVVPIAMPPLRERGRDVTILADRFLRDAAELENKDFAGFDSQAYDILCAYDWPGNVRQLENVIRNIVVLNQGRLVTAAMLSGLANLGAPQVFIEPNVEKSVAANSIDDAPIVSENMMSKDWLVRPLEEIEILAIQTTIDHFNGNITHASRSLNLSTSTIYRKLKAWEKKQNAA